MLQCPLLQPQRGEPAWWMSEGRQRATLGSPEQEERGLLVVLWSRQWARACRLPPATKVLAGSAFITVLLLLPPLLAPPAHPPPPLPTVGPAPSTVPPSPVLGQGRLSVFTHCRRSPCWTLGSAEAGLSLSGHCLLTPDTSHTQLALSACHLRRPTVLNVVTISFSHL